MPDIKGNIIFSFSEENGIYHIIYDEELAKGDGFNRFVGAIYKMMREYPELIEEILQAATKAAEELNEPFNDILNERPTKDQT